MVTEKRDYYELLGVERTASGDEIKRAYRVLARKYHPDVNAGDKDSEEQFKEVAEAYEVLSDDQKRQRYDRFGHQGVGGAAGAGSEGFGGGFGDIFDIFFNGAGGQAQQRNGPQRGADLRYDLEVTLEEAYRGVAKTIKFARVESCDTCSGSGAAPGTKPETCTACNGAGQVRSAQNTFFGTVQKVVPCARCQGRGRIIPTPCTTCQGRGRVERERELPVAIPAGVDTGMQMPMRGEGEAGVQGGPSGDLYLFFHVRDDSRFERHGRDLRSAVTLTFAQAALGDEITVPTVGGEKGTVVIPEGTQTGATFRLRGLGMPDVRSAGVKGDLHVAVRVEVPTRLTDEEKKLLRQFALLRGEKNPNEQHKGFLGKLKDAVMGHDEVG
jgi:molecular chaperone DnaJ